GVLLGGLLTNTLNWHWIFLVNLPIGAVVFVLSRMLLPAAHRAEDPGRLDVAGAIIVTAALMLAVYAIVNGNDAGWTSGQTIGLLARPLGQARHAVRHQAATHDRAAAGRRWTPALRASTGRWELCRRCAPEHDPARIGWRHRLQPGVACRHERRCAN